MEECPKQILVMSNLKSNSFIKNTFKIFLLFQILLKSSMAKILKYKVSFTKS